MALGEFGGGERAEYVPWFNCPWCEGSGELGSAPDLDNTCPDCNGAGGHRGLVIEPSVYDDIVYPFGKPPFGLDYRNIF